MQNENRCEPIQESCYFDLIVKCNNFVDEIGKKTKFIQIQKPDAGSAKELSCGSELKESLEQLVRKLETLSNSYQL